MAQVTQRVDIGTTVESITAYMERKIAHEAVPSCGLVLDVITQNAETLGREGLEKLILLMLKTANDMRRQTTGPFQFSADYEAMLSATAQDIAALLPANLPKQLDTRPVVDDFAAQTLPVC